MKILIWGTGRAVAHVLKYRVKLDDVEAFIDNDSSKKEFMNRPIITPDQINVREYDIIIVATDLQVRYTHNVKNWELI